MVSCSGELTWTSHLIFDRHRGRFLGYAGLSMILTIPCLFLSAAAARRVLQLHRNNQHSHYSFKNSTGPFYLGSQLSNERDVTSGRLVTDISPDNSPTSIDPETPHSTQPTGPGTDVRDAAFYDNPGVSPCPAFGTPSSSPKLSGTWEGTDTVEQDDEFDPRRQIRGMTLTCKPHLLNRVRYKKSGIDTIH